jgi:hypothetical protein
MIHLKRTSPLNPGGLPLRTALVAWTSMQAAGRRPQGRVHLDTRKSIYKDC